MSKEEKAAETSKGGKNEGDDSISRKRKKDEIDDKDGNSSTKRCCARCRNHEPDLQELKGHKNFCRWRDCLCEMCLKTVFRQKLMADQTANRRKRQEMERRKKEGLPIMVPTVNQVKRFKRNCVFSPPPEPVVSFSSTTTGSKEVSWEAITELMNFFNFNVNTSALLYLILKYISNNVKEACNIILNAKEDIKKISNKALNSGATPVYTMNQLEVVPVFVVPSEKVLDLSSHPGLGYPRTPTQNYPYPRAAGPPPPPPPPPPSSCFQPFRPPTWQQQPAPTYELNPYSEVSKDDSREEKIEEKREEEKTAEVGEKRMNDTHDSAQETYNETTQNVSHDTEKVQNDLKNDQPKEENYNSVSNGAREMYDSIKEEVRSSTARDSTIYKDEFFIYGEHIGNQLRTLKDRHSLTVARYEIDQIIFRAIMGEYCVASCECCLQDLPEQQSFSQGRSPQSKLHPLAFQPHQPLLRPQPIPVQPHPIRPTIANVGSWTGVK